MTDVVVGALIAAIAPTLAVVLTHLRVRRVLADIHSVVNSRLDAALAKIAALEEIIRSRT